MRTSPIYCHVKLSLILHGFALVWYFLVLSCIDTVEVTLSDWRDTTLVLERLISEKFGTDRYSDEAYVICYLFGVPVCPFSFNCIIVICNPCLDGIIDTLDKIQKPTFRSRAFWSFTSDTHSSMFRWFLPWNQGHNQGFASARYSTWTRNFLSYSNSTRTKHYSDRIVSTEYYKLQDFHDYFINYVFEEENLHKSTIV